MAEEKEVLGEAAPGLHRPGYGTVGGSNAIKDKRLDHFLLRWSELYLLEKSALLYTRVQWKSEVEKLEVDRYQLMEQVAALREQMPDQ